MKEKTKELLQDIGWALYMTARAHALDIISGVILNPLSKRMVKIIDPMPNVGSSRLLSARALARKSIDGAFLGGPAPIGYAKFALRKGLPGPGQKKMGIENDPHTVDDFNGEIKEGYGKGTKKLIWSGQAVIKQEGKTWVGKANYHEHRADRAGLHYDFVAEGVEPNTKQFEFNIPGGSVKGRYAAIRMKDGSMLFTRMQDRSVLLPKPTFNLKNREWLVELDKNPDNTIVEWKPDGSMANIKIEGYRAIFRSHRPEGDVYYEKLPAIEWLNNNSSLLSSRLLFPGPDQDGTVLKGELFHPEGAARVGGILNSGADKAIAYQQEHGPVTVYIWDIVKLRGKDVSSLPYTERRMLYENVVADIERFNQGWQAVPSISGGGFVHWYDSITGDKRGLPWSEGVVIKRSDSNSGDQAWQKVKFRDTVDLRIIDVIEGTGKRAGSVGRFLVEGPGGGRGEIGSFAVPEWETKQYWQDHVNHDALRGQVIECYVQEMTKVGSPRAGVHLRFHPSKSTYAFDLSAAAIAGVDGRNPNDVKYAMKTSHGWRPK